MARYAIGRPDILSFPGDIVEGPDAENTEDAGFYSRPPLLEFISNRTENGNTYISIPFIQDETLDIVARVRVIREGEQSFTNTGPGLAFRVPGSSDLAYFAARSNAGLAQWGGFYTLIGGTQTQLGGNISTSAFSATYAWFWIRARKEGNSFSYAVWADGAAPPALTTYATVNIPELSGPLAPSLRGRQYPMIWECSYYSVGTAGDEPFLSPPTYKVSGEVLDIAGQPMEVLVRVFDRYSGIILAETFSDAITGEWEAGVDNFLDVDVRFYYPDGTVIYNDLVHSRVTPELVT